MSAPVKYSSQREAIIRFLKTRKDHPTADVVFQHIREEIPTISLATVYRNLNQLAETGAILRLTCNGKTDHFDACIDPHYHFLCKQCGAVKDIHFTPTDDLIHTASANCNFNIEEVSVLFSGTCDDCR